MSNTKPNKRLTAESNSAAIALRTFVLLVLLVLCCGGVFGQNQPILENGNVNEGPSTDRLSPDNSYSRTELLLWFMGNKPMSPNQEDLDSDSKGKKVFIDLGMTPNRILSKSLMKKALNFDQTIA